MTSAKCFGPLVRAHLPFPCWILANHGSPRHSQEHCKHVSCQNASPSLKMNHIAQPNHRDEATKKGQNMTKLNQRTTPNQAGGKINLAEPVQTNQRTKKNKPSQIQSHQTNSSTAGPLSRKGYSESSADEDAMEHKLQERRNVGAWPRVSLQTEFCCEY